MFHEWDGFIGKNFIFCSASSIKYQYISISAKKLTIIFLLWLWLCRLKFLTKQLDCTNCMWVSPMTAQLTGRILKGFHNGATQCIPANEMLNRMEDEKNKRFFSSLDLTNFYCFIDGSIKHIGYSWTWNSINQYFAIALQWCCIAMLHCLQPFTYSLCCRLPTWAISIHFLTDSHFSDNYKFLLYPNNS